MKIVILDGYTLNPGDLSWEGFEKLGKVHHYDRTPPDQVLERSLGAEAVLTNKTPLPASIIESLPSLQYIGVLATGYNIVDVKSAQGKGITVTNVPGYGTHSVAQFVFALLLELCHRVGLHNTSVQEGEWARSPDWCYWKSPQTELAGKVMGVIGMGRIGNQVAQLAKAFGMKVLFTGGTAPGEFRRVELETLLRESDVVSIHCPLTPETKGLINHGRLSLMKSSAFLINTSRGPIVAEADLAKALNDRVIAGAALDVLATEPPPQDHVLRGIPNCILTPHMAWGTREARSRLMSTAVKNLQAFLRGEESNVIKA